MARKPSPENENTVRAITTDIANIINKLSTKLHLDPMYVIGSLFILELIKSKYAKYPLWAVFYRPTKISAMRVAKEFVLKKNDIYLELNPQELVDFMACDLKFETESDEKDYVIRSFEESGFGIYDSDRDVFLYTGCPQLVNAMRLIVKEYERIKQL